MAKRDRIFVQTREFTVQESAGAIPPLTSKRHDFLKGHPIQQTGDSMFCARCGQSAPPGSKYCGACGSAVAAPSGREAGIIYPDPQPQPRSGIWHWIVGVSCLVLLLWAGLLVNSTENRGRETTEAEQLRRLYDPPSKEPLTPKKHLERAQKLLGAIDGEGYKNADALVQMVTDHAIEAKKDPRLRAKVNSVMRQLGEVSLNAVKYRVWESTRALATAQVMCKMLIESRLKAPSTAEWSQGQAGKLTNRPGTFLVGWIVDAENSFGARLRAEYECEVACLSEDVCNIKKIYETR